MKVIVLPFRLHILDKKLILYIICKQTVVVNGIYRKKTMQKIFWLVL